MQISNNCDIIGIGIRYHSLRERECRLRRKYIIKREIGRIKEGEQYINIIVLISIALKMSPYIGLLLTNKLVPY